MFPRGLRASCFGNTDAVLFIPSEGNQVTCNSSPSTPGPAGCVERDPKKQDSKKKKKKGGFNGFWTCLSRNNPASALRKKTGSFQIEARGSS